MDQKKRDRIKSRWTIAYETVDGLRYCLLEGMPMIPLFFDLLILFGLVVLTVAPSLSIFKKRIRQEF